MRNFAAILGEDGKIHDGSIAEKMWETLMTTNCGVAGMRPIRKAAEVERLNPKRICPTCWQETDPPGTGFGAVIGRHGKVNLSASRRLA